MNTKEFKSVMARNEDTQEQLAKAVGIQLSGINARINGNIQWRASEIGAVIRRYKLTPAETMKIFFEEEAS